MAVLAAVLAACTGATRSTPSVPIPPTAAPVVIATPVPTPTATRPAPTPISPPRQPTAPSGRPAVYVTNTGGQGLTLRRTPGGERITTLPDGTALTTTGEEAQADGRPWRQVRDVEGRDGWAAAEFLTADAPPALTPSTGAAPSPSPTSTPTAVPTATPTWPVPLIPTITLRPADAAPTRSPVPRESPAAAASATLPPVMAPFAPRPTPAAPATGAAAAPPATGLAPDRNCHPSYPDFCVPPPPPDLNCSSAALAGRRRFTVRPPDPHRLDSNRDGIGCE